jgi:hypothetical protein
VQQWFDYGWCSRVTMAQDGVFFKKASLNKASVPKMVYLGAMHRASAFLFDG